MKIGIVGGGAIGLTFAAALSTVHDVIVLERSHEIVDVVRRSGVAVIEDEETEFVAVRATLDAAQLADRAAVIVAVKAYATHGALTPLASVLPPSTLLASIQNGLDNDAAARAALPGVRFALGVTTHGALSLGPGRIRAAGRGCTIFARESSAHPTSDELVEAFAQAGLEAQAVDDIAPVLWGKLVANAAINPLGALTRRPNGAVVDDADLVQLARALAAEASAVAAAEGVPFENAWEIVEGTARATAHNRNSMLQDLEAGRPTEIEAIGGALLARAAAHGIAVPLTGAVVALIRARERG